MSSPEKPRGFTVEDIDDTMLERALKAQWYPGTPIGRDQMREFLRVALTHPPPEPEIEASAPMRHEGWTALAGRGCFFPSMVEALETARVCYVAMERQRLREAAEDPRPAPPQIHVHHRQRDPLDETPRMHSRSTDPGGFKPHSFRGIVGCGPQRVYLASGGAAVCWRHGREGDPAPVTGPNLGLYFHRRKDDPS